MENKLEQLTQKLRKDGLELGRAEAEEMVTAAEAKAKQIVADAEAKAAKIAADAKAAAEELAKNTANDVRMASEQTISMLRKQIAEMVLLDVASGEVSKAWKDGDFVRSIIMEAVKAFNPSADEEVKVVVSDEMLVDVKAAIAAKFNAGVEVVADGRVKVPFRIVPKDGGYYVNFTDEDFVEMLKQTLRPKVAEFLFVK